MTQKEVNFALLGPLLKSGPGKNYRLSPLSTALDIQPLKPIFIMFIKN
jgi:hypothetical protein